MRQLILGCLLALLFPAAAAADNPNGALCRPIESEWARVSSGGDLAAMDREIAKIPPLCSTLHSEAVAARTRVAARQAAAVRSPKAGTAAADAQAAEVARERDQAAAARQAAAAAEAARQELARAQSDRDRARAIEAEQQAASADLSGVWHGTYQYVGSGQGPVAFDFNAVFANGTVTGTMSERNSFAAGGCAYLRSNVQGTLEGEAVRFTKTYDGSCASHSVQYEGVLDRSQQTVTGSWTISGTVGQFSMSRTR